MFEHLAAVLIHLVGLSPEETCPKFVIDTQKRQTELKWDGLFGAPYCKDTWSAINFFLVVGIRIAAIRQKSSLFRIFFSCQRNKRFSSATNCCVHIIQVKLTNIDSISSLSFKYLCSSVYISLNMKKETRMGSL